MRMPPLLDASLSLRPYAATAEISPGATLIKVNSGSNPAPFRGEKWCRLNVLSASTGGINQNVRASFAEF